MSGQVSIDDGEVSLSQGQGNVNQVRLHQVKVMSRQDRSDQVGFC